MDSEGQSASLGFGSNTRTFPNNATKARLEHVEALRSVNTGVQPNAPKQPAALEEGQAQPWRWSCEKCSDTSCEHRLFSQLMAAQQIPSKGNS